MPTSVSLSPHFESFIQEQIRSGRFNNVSEVVRAALRQMEEVEAQNIARREALRSAIAEGLASGPAMPAEDVLASLEKRLARKLRGQRV